MAVLKLVTRMPRRTRLRQRDVRAENRAHKIVTVIAEAKDYNGMSSEDWKAALSKDISERFGPIPTDLVPVGEAGW